MVKANGIQVSDIDMAATLDIQPRYSDIITIFCWGCTMADEVGQAWLQHLEEV